MNGAESLVRTLVENDVNVCFGNPGTSEMHFVAALDRVEGMRCVLGLFEGVVTGAADGYYRIAGKPASTILHLGPGLGNGLANLHNAKKARSGIVNIVGEHASHHIQYDAPLTADVEGVARPMSDWVKTSRSSRSIAVDGAEAIRQARSAPGRIATLILPADTAWGEADGPAVVPDPIPPARVDRAAVVAAARSLSGPETMLLLGGGAVRGRALEWAGRIAAETGCRLMAEFNNARMECGVGRVRVDRMPYNVDLALAAMKEVRQLVLAGAKAPVSFFAYPGKPSVLAPADCAVTKLAGAEDDLEGALEALGDELGARTTPPAPLSARNGTTLPTGKVTPDGIAAVLAALLPERAIVADEAVSTGRAFGPAMSGAAPHDWLNIMGGSIGWALPISVGAAIAAPDRKVVALEGDGSAMYTMQALWTMAREGLDVTVIVFANRAYQILRGELASVGASAPGRRANDMLTLDRPDLDWVALANGHGVEAGRAATLDELAREFRRGLAVTGPYLIELVI
jgi:acetolactate synthase I/II/III large subunit